VDLKQLEYFVKVAELESVTRASTLLGITQPSLSRQIRLLEVELRQTLLVRNGRGVQPTEAGVLLAKHARAMLLQAERARKEVIELRGVPTGRVTIGMPSSVSRFLSAPLAFAFKARFPNAALSIMEGQTYIMEWLSMGRVDIGVLINPQPLPSMDVVTLLKEPLYLVSAGDNTADQPPFGPPIALKDLSQFNLMLPCRPHAIRTFLESQLASFGVELEVDCEIDAFSPMLELIRKGFGHGVMPEVVFRGDELRSQYLLRQIVEPDLVSTVAIATHSARPLSPLAAGVIALMQEIVSETDRPDAVS
jgi:LysR family transcriptional regulator, nitrogen assimilation regulatory protein